MAKDATRLREDSDAIAAVTEEQKGDAKQMWMVADLEEKKAHEEEAEAREEEADAAAIQAVAASKKDARASEDAKQIKEIAAKEEKDATDTETDVVHLRKDAKSIVASIFPSASDIVETIKGWMSWGSK